MNKFLQKLAKIFLGLSMATGVGVAVTAGRKDASPASAADNTVTWTASSGALGSTISSVNGTATGSITLSGGGSSYTMSYTRTLKALASGKSDYVAWQGSTWIQLGSGNASESIVFTTSAIPGTIKSVSIQAATNGTHTYTIDVGGTKYANGLSLSTYSGTISSTNPTPADTTKTGTGTSEGTITITINPGTRKAMLIRSVSVTYNNDAPADYVGSLSVSPSTWSGYDTQTLSVSNFTVSGSKNGTAGAVTSSDYDFQGIGYMSGDNFVARDASFSSGNPTTADTRLAWKAKYPTTSGGSTYAWAYVTLTVTADSVQSLAITGSMTNTTYTQGHAWDPTGFTVNAYYASAPSTPVDVTNNAGLSWSYSPATTASTSTTSVTCTASFGGQTATSSAQSVTINEKTNLGGIEDGEKYFIIANGYYLQAFNNAPPAAAGTAVTWPGDSNMPSADTNTWTFTSTGDDDNWVITSQAGNTLYATGTNNGLGCTSSGDDNWTVIDSGTNGLKLQASGGRYLTCYPSGTNFRVYTTTSSQGEVNSTVRFVKYVAPATAATINGDDEVVMGSSWSPTSVTEDVGGATVTGVTFAFAASDGATLTATDTSTGAFTSSTAGTVTVSGTKDGYTITSKVVTVVDNTPYIHLTLNSASSAYTGQTVSISASYGNGVTGLSWTVQSGTVSDASSSNSGYSAKIAGSTGTLTIRATDTGSNLYEEVSVNVTKTAFTTYPSNASVQEGKTTTLSAVLNSGGNINWSSGDNTIASVGESTGVVTGVAEGSVTITAQSADDTSVTASCTITVTEAPGEIVITSAEIASFASSYAERDWTYGSGTAAISGKIKAYKNGDNIQLNHNNTCYFYNTDAVPGYITGITLTKVSGTTDMTAWVGDEELSSDPATGGTTNTTYTWTFDPADHHSYFRVATSGSTGARVFSALTITYQKVALVDPTSITITDKTAISMDTYGYGKRNLTAVVGPVNANDKTVTWGTSDSSVVTVSNGVLTPVGVGDAIVYATAVGYVSDQATPALKDSVSVHVTQALYKKATFTPTSLTTATQGDDYLPGGSVSLTNTSAGTWSSEKSAIQLSQGKNATFTISGYAGMMIEGIDMVVSSNGNAGAGSLNVTAGSTTVLSIATASFDDSSWNGAYDANPVQLYRDITDYVVADSETIVFTFAATVNSLYIHSVSFRYIDYSLDQWCIDFLAEVTCDGSSAITDDSKWDDLGLEFLDLDEDLQAMAAGATANKDSDDVIEQAMARYDLIIRKYGTDTSSGGHEDFIGRFGVGKINGPLNQSRLLLSNMFGDNTNTVAIIVIISMVSMTAIGGYFFLRKRKENI